MKLPKSTGSNKAKQKRFTPRPCKVPALCHAVFFEVFLSFHPLFPPTVTELSSKNSWGRG